jgi:hypothetical protein
MVTGKVGKVLPGLAAGPACGNLQNICTVCKKYPLVCEFIITNKQKEYIDTASSAGLIYLYKVDGT